MLKNAKSASKLKTKLKMLPDQHLVLTKWKKKLKTKKSHELRSKSDLIKNNKNTNPKKKKKKKQQQ